MSRFIQYDKTSTYLENMNNAKMQRERRMNSEIEQMKKDKFELDKIKNEMEYEEKLEKEKKALMKKKQYEEYLNYMKFKQNKIPEEMNELNIKLGGDNRTIKKQNYNEQMDNLCLNPTKNENIFPQKQFINFSQAGRNYQRGYSHGYNILTGEIFEQQNKNVQMTEGKENIEKMEYNLEEKEIDNKKEQNKLNEEDYLAYMEMLRQKELEQNNIFSNNREEVPYQYEELYDKTDNININNNPNQNIIQPNLPYQYNEYSDLPKKSYHVVPQSQQINKYQENIKSNNQYQYNVLDSSNSEYLLNKRKNMTSYEDIYKGKEYHMNHNNINENEKNKKLEKQKEYAKILEGQINSKNIYYETMRNLSKNSEPERDRFKNDNNLLFGGMNPYMKIKERNNKLSDIPEDPYSYKNFNINSNNSHLNSNPILNPENNNQLNDRIRTSERLQKNGNIIIAK